MGHQQDLDRMNNYQRHLSDRRQSQIENDYLEQELLIESQKRRGLENKIDSLSEVLKGFFIKEVVLQIMFKNNEDVTSSSLEKKVKEVNNNTKLLNSIEQDFYNLVFNISQEKNFLIDSKNKYLTKESEKLAASKVIFKEQMVKNNAYTKAIKDMSEIWGKGEKTLTANEIRDLLEEKLKEAFKDSEFIQTLDSVYDEKISKEQLANAKIKQDKKKKMG